MPRYFFHIQDGVEMPDQEGLDLPGPAEARQAAIAAARELLTETASNLPAGSEWRVRVTDEAGASVCDLSFAMVCS